MEKELKHLNSVLRAIRNINQLIVKEHDRKKLIQGACNNFTKERGYHNAWIAILDDEGKLIDNAESKVGKDLQALLERIKKGKLSACWEKAISSSDIIINKDPKKDCTDCPLADSYSGRGALTIKLSYGKKVYGILSASTPLEYIDDKEEKELFYEIAGDISFALHSIENEEKNKKVTEQLELVMDTGEHGFWDWNLDTDDVYFSPHYYGMLGYKPGELPERKETWVGLMHPEDRKIIVPKVEKYVKNSKSYEVEFRLKTKEGGWKWISGKGKSYNIDKDGVSHRLAGVHVDITKSKKAEILLKTERDKFQKYLDIVAAVVVIMNSNGKISLINKEGCSVLEHTEDEIVGKNWFNNFLPKRVILDIRQMAKELFSEKLQQAEYYENLVLTKSGKEKLIAWHNATLKDSNGKVVSILSSGKDITKIKEQEKKLRLSYSKLKRTLDDTIDTLVAVVEIQDPYTAGHQKRVAKLAVAISEKLDISQNKANGVKIAAKIHDIGKISIPQSILSKPGMISDIEYEMIKTHPKVGYDMVKNIKFGNPIAKILLQHHERLDGSGYPNGLKGKDIIFEAKILAVADIVEAMTSRRPYRDALGIDKALDEISKNKGVLYDSEVVNACIMLFKKDGYKFD